MSTSQHWAIPLDVYKSIDFDIEGFASPINSQAIMLSHNKVHKNFCSLFYDTDKVFGSLGSFFEQNFAGKKVVINPPFIQEIIDKSIDYIVPFLSKANTIFYYCAPEHMIEPNIKKIKKYIYEKKYYTGQFETGEGLTDVSTPILWLILKNLN